MSRTANPLELFFSPGDDSIYKTVWSPTGKIEQPDSKHTYTRAKVSPSEGSSTKTFYIVYEQENWMGRSRRVPDPNILLGSSDEVETEFAICSAQGFDIKNPGLVLFSCPNLQGVGEQFVDSQELLTKPIDKGSFVCTGGKWDLYFKPNYGQPSISVTKGDINNLEYKIFSIRRQLQ